MQISKLFVSTFDKSFGYRDYVVEVHGYIISLILVSSVFLCNILDNSHYYVGSTCVFNSLQDYNIF